jgi:hypothetical protein
MSYSWGAARNPAAVVQPRPLIVRRPEPEQDPIELHRAAAQLAPMVDLWERLIAQHVPNHSGRCSKCTKGGTGLPSTPWPCVVYGVAEMARRRHGREQG